MDFFGQVESTVYVQEGEHVFAVKNIGTTERPFSVFHRWQSWISPTDEFIETLRYIFIMPGWQTKWGYLNRNFTEWLISEVPWRDERSTTVSYIPQFRLSPKAPILEPF